MSEQNMVEQKMHSCSACHNWAHVPVEIDHFDCENPQAKTYETTVPVVINSEVMPCGDPECDTCPTSEVVQGI